MSFDIFTAYATDENLENNGTTFPMPQGGSLLIARAGNRKYAKALMKAAETRRLELDSNDDELAAKASDEVIASVMAETILLGFSGLSFKGEDVPYSLVNAKKLLAIKDFRKYVAGLSDQMDAYKFKVEQEAGNGSAGT